MHAARAQVRVPKEVSDEEAAQFLVNPVTAYGCVSLHKGNSLVVAHSPCAAAACLS